MAVPLTSPLLTSMQYIPNYAFSKIIFLIKTLKYYTDMIDNIGGTA